MIFSFGLIAYMRLARRVVKSKTLPSKTRQPKFEKKLLFGRFARIINLSQPLSRVFRRGKAGSRQAGMIVLLVAYEFSSPIRLFGCEADDLNRG